MNAATASAATGSRRAPPRMPHTVNATAAHAASENAANTSGAGAYARTTGFGTKRRRASASGATSMTAVTTRQPATQPTRTRNDQSAARSTTSPASSASPGYKGMTYRVMAVGDTQHGTKRTTMQAAD